MEILHICQNKQILKSGFIDIRILEKLIREVHMIRVKKHLDQEKSFSTIIKIAHQGIIQPAACIKELFGDGDHDKFVIRCVLKGIPRDQAEIAAN